MSFLLFVLAVVTVAYLYVGLRLLVPAPSGWGWKLLGGILIAGLLALPPLAIYARVKGWPPGVETSLAWTAYVSLGYFSLLFVTLLVRDVLLLAAVSSRFAWRAWAAKSQTGNPGPFGNPGRSRHPVRRVTHRLNVAILVLVAGVCVYGFYEAQRIPGVKQIEIPIENLPASFEGFRIVQITDVHVGPTIKKDFVQSVADEVMTRKPDMIVITGDLVDGSVPELREDVAPLAGLSAPYGRFFVTGNHEYYSGVVPWTEEMKRLGYRVLLNEHAVIEKDGASVVLAGVTDTSGGRFRPDHRSDPGKAIEGAPGNKVRILLAHQPRSVFAASEHGYDLQISGHTHGGQYFPFRYFVYLQQPFVSGLHDYGALRVFVSQGTGYWGPPNRFGVPSEIVEIILKRK